jgi:hypothetical protein
VDKDSKLPKESSQRSREVRDLGLDLVRASATDTIAEKSEATLNERSVEKEKRERSRG